jgi:NOL1/NOP2/sun family putative RNA methylase
MRNDKIPEAFITRWAQFYGKQTASEIKNKLNIQDPRIITPNSLHTDLGTLKHNLERKGFNFTVLPEFNSLRLDYEPFNVVSTPEYLSGMFSIQALTSLLPPYCLNPSKGSLVADLASSPGVKTCFLGQIMDNTGSIFAFEKSKQRISALKSNISRMGIENCIILNCDSTHLPKLDLSFDHILLDAPCSGTGLKIPKNKRISKKTLPDINRHAKLQEILIEKAWNHLKIGGSLVYSTCSLEPEEGELQIENFLTKHKKQSKLIPVRSNIGTSGQNTNWEFNFDQELQKTRRIFPDVGIDGFFVALIRRIE